MPLISVWPVRESTSTYLNSSANRSANLPNNQGDRLYKSSQRNVLTRCEYCSSNPDARQVHGSDLLVTCPQHLPAVTASYEHLWSNLPSDRTPAHPLKATSLPPRPSLPSASEDGWQLPSFSLPSEHFGQDVGPVGHDAVDSEAE